MAQQIKILTAKSHGVPESLTVGENWFSKIVLWPPHHVPHTHQNTANAINNLKISYFICSSHSQHHVWTLLRHDTFHPRALALSYQILRTILSFEFLQKVPFECIVCFLKYTYFEYSTSYLASLSTLVTEACYVPSSLHSKLQSAEVDIVLILPQTLSYSCQRLSLFQMKNRKGSKVK